MAQPGNINAACRHIGGNQRPQLTTAKITQHLLPHRLAHVAMQRIDGQPAYRQKFCQRIGTPLGAHKNKHLTGGFVPQNIAQPVALFAFGHQCDALGDFIRCDAGLRGFDPFRIAQKLLAKGFNFRRHCR